MARTAAVKEEGETPTHITSSETAGSSSTKSPSIVHITAAIIAVMNEVKGVEKNTTIGSGNYAYKGVSDQDVKKTIGDAMARNGLAIVPTRINGRAEVSRWMEGTTSKQSIFTEVEPTYLLMHTSGEWIEVCGYGHGVDPQDKAAGKASTYALKYTLLYLFLVPTGKIDDADDTHSQDIPAPKAADTRKPVTALQLEAVKERMQLQKGETPREVYDKALAHYQMTEKQKDELKALIPTT